MKITIEISDERAAALTAEQQYVDANRVEEERAGSPEKYAQQLLDNACDSMRTRHDETTVEGQRFKADRLAIERDRLQSLIDEANRKAASAETAAQAVVEEAARRVEMAEAAAQAAAAERDAAKEELALAKPAGDDAGSGARSQE